MGLHLLKGSGSPGGNVKTAVGAVDLTAGDFTVAQWIKFDVAPNSSGIQQYIWSRNDNTGANAEIGITILSNGTTISYCGISAIAILTGTAVISDTNWHLFVVTRSGTTWTQYWDNVQDVQGTSATACINNSGTRGLFIGVNDSNNFNVNATLAEGASWNVCLSAGELAALAKGVPPNNIRFLSLILYIPMNQRAGTGAGNAFSIPDLSKNSTTNAPTVGTFNGDAQTANHCPCGQPAGW